MRLGQIFRKMVPFVFLVALAISMTPAKAATAQFSLQAVPNKAAYYLGEAVNLQVNFAWQDLINNHTITLALFADNGTKLQDLYTLSDITGNGSYTNVFTLTGLTNMQGSKTYYIKAIENEIVLTQAPFTINVQVPTYRITVAWSDADENRKVDTNELVTFTIFVDWAFLNSSKNATLYVSIDGKEQVIDNIQMSAGSGSVQRNYQLTFDSEGSHIVVFSLKDSEENILASSNLEFNVGQTKEEASLFSISAKTAPYIFGGMAFAAIVIIAIVLVVKK